MLVQSLIIYNLLPAFIVLMCYLGKKTELKLFTILGFVTLFVFSAIRYDVGHDYSNYVLIFSQLSDIYLYGLLDISILTIYEPFTIILSVLFSFLDNPSVAILPVYSLVHAILLYKCFKYYGTSVLGVFVFFCFGYFAFNLDVVRQGLAIMFFLFSIRYIENRDFKRFFLFILLAFFTHYSAIIIFPFYFLLKIKINRYVCLVIICVFVIGYYLSIWEKFREVVFSLIPYYSDRYEGKEAQLDTQQLQTGLGMLFNVLISTVVVFFLSKKKRVLANVAFWGIILYLFANGNYNIERISYYLLYSLIFSLPIFFSFKRYRQFSYILILGLILLYQRNIDKDPRGITPYITIFSDDFEQQIYKPCANCDNYWY